MRIILLIGLFSITLWAKLNVAVSYPYIGAIVKAVGDDKVNVTVLAKGNWDPHFVVPRPSLISKLRNADVIIINGAQLEIGWIPPLIKRANNRKLYGKGFLDLSQKIDLIEVPKRVSRAGGDVHPDGNPHFHLDPHNIPKLATAIAAFISGHDTANSSAYHANAKAFNDAWADKLTVWDRKMAAAKNKKVLQYHKVFSYFLRAYGLESIGTIEPLPGISPSSRHTMDLISIIKTEQPCCILHDVYHPTKTAMFLEEKTGISLIVVPHDIGALDDVNSLPALYEHLINSVAP